MEKLNSVTPLVAFFDKAIKFGFLFNLLSF